MAIRYFLEVGRISSGPTTQVSEASKQVGSLGPGLASVGGGSHEGSDAENLGDEFQSTARISAWRRV